MGDSALGLILGMSLDNTQALMDMGRFEESVSGGFNRAAAATKPLGDALDGTNKNLLSNRESVRLFSEEMGVHLPRAVSSAVAEILPSIGSMGTAFLGVFAIEQAVKWGDKVYNIITDLQSGTTKALDDIGKAAEVAGKHAHDEIAKTFSDFKTVAGAGLPMEEVNLRAQQLTKYYQAFLDLQKAQNAMRQPSIETMKVVGAAVAEGLTNIEDVRQKLNEVSALQLAQHRRLAEVQKKEDKEDCDAAIKNARAVAKAEHEREMGLHRTIEVLNRVRMQQIHAGQEAGKVVQQMQKDEAAERAEQDRLNKSQLLFTQELERMGIVMHTIILPQFAQEVAATRHLTQAQLLHVAVLQQIRQHAAAAKQEMGGLASATIQAGVAAAMYGQNIGKAMEAALKSTLVTIASEAAVRALYNVALGIYYEAIHDYPDASLAFSAAAMFGTVALAAGAAGAAIPSGGGGRGGAAAPGNQSSYGGAPGSGGGSGPGGGGGGSHGPTIVMNMYGPLAGSYTDLAKALTPVLNQLGTSGQIRLTSYNAMTNGPKQTGH